MMFRGGFSFKTGHVGFSISVDRDWQFAQAIVSREIVNNGFAIKIGQPHVNVSWQVTGIRRDAWAASTRPRAK
jgi:hypothetical protein